MDGAEAAYCAAIAADPGCAMAHSDLGDVLEARAQEKAKGKKARGRGRK